MFAKKGVVVPRGDSHDFDDNYLYYPSVIEHAGRFFMYYGGNGAVRVRIGLATSKDGITFIKKGVVVPLGATNNFDDSVVHSPIVINGVGWLFMYYSGYDGSNYRIGLATSKDGITFVKKGVVVPLGATNDFDDTRVYFPTVIKHAGRFFMYYSGYDGSKTRIGLATSKDGITFVKKGVVVPLGATNDFDDNYLYSPTIIKHAGRFFMYYGGHDGSKTRIGFATSKDGV